jgi:hypothetical protein
MTKRDHRGKKALLLVLLTGGLTIGSLVRTVAPADARWVRRCHRDRQHHQWVRVCHREWRGHHHERI